MLFHALLCLTLHSEYRKNPPYSIQPKTTANCELPTADLSYRDFRAGDVRHSQADISKAQKLLGYKPGYKISEGLDEAMDWYVESLTQ